MHNPKLVYAIQCCAVHPYEHVASEATLTPCSQCASALFRSTHERVVADTGPTPTANHTCRSTSCSELSMVDSNASCHRLRFVCSCNNVVRTTLRLFWRCLMLPLSDAFLFRIACDQPAQFDTQPLSHADFSSLLLQAGHSWDLFCLASCV